MPAAGAEEVTAGATRPHVDARNEADVALAQGLRSVLFRARPPAPFLQECRHGLIWVGGKLRKRVRGCTLVKSQLDEACYVMIKIWIGHRLGKEC